MKTWPPCAVGFEPTATRATSSWTGALSCGDGRHGVGLQITTRGTHVCLASRVHPVLAL
jgi:hypothetical protein